MDGYLGTLENGAEKFVADELERKKKYCSEVLGINCDTCPAGRAWCPANKEHKDFLEEVGQIGVE